MILGRLTKGVLPYQAITRSATVSGTSVRASVAQASGSSLGIYGRRQWYDDEELHNRARGRRHPRDIPTNGYQILGDAIYNQGTAFNHKERRRMGLRGLLPPRVRNCDEQEAGIKAKLDVMRNPLNKYAYLMGLQDRNEALFHKVVLRYFKEVMPIIYTPTVGLACQQYSRIFRRPRGLYITPRDKGFIRDILDNWVEANVRVIVVTDGERILGLGDLGCQGMGIPVGKLALYTGCAGIDPQTCLPVVIDVGTNNEEIRNDPLYIGLPQERIRGKEYEELLDEFMEAVKHEYGQTTLVQFEDFGSNNAFKILDRYRNDYCCFNDDIQGTAAVSLAGLFGSQRLTGNNFADNKFLFFGAAQAGTGIGELVVNALMAEGLSEEEARLRCWFVDSKGLVVKSRWDQLQPHKKPFAHEHEEVKGLENIIDTLKPTALIGVSGQGQTFTEDVIKTMCKYNERPIIFALSNPTSHAECTAEEAIKWSDGKAVFACGSPFDTVEYNGKKIEPGQGNNAYIFPGVGLAVSACDLTRVNDEMFMIAAKTLAAALTENDLAVERVYPPLDSIRSISLKIATEVGVYGFKNGLAAESEENEYLIRQMNKQGVDVIRHYIESQMYHPDDVRLGKVVAL
eukprot:Clim_evm6s27 gene=Clim_evmTU6s27